LALNFFAKIGKRVGFAKWGKFKPERFENQLVLMKKINFYKKQEIKTFKTIKILSYIKLVFLNET
jgi:hypothetical protein